ncbi:hypothetical protein [Streptacidiphilus sp. P02-A3a]|uniref:hypothetical protein n=1 Tax=Streptacidiphilus sp. P02-A3a TaxID=2704468 RepID=UPI0015FCFE98|nr:hypothetical protein [Streptacidiphilus sp. P02-A3a]QMU69794.1 hypothetical protein GXP74_17650 [Streptacidiphilus sp. P02-A3a]
MGAVPSRARGGFTLHFAVWLAAGFVVTLVLAAVTSLTLLHQGTNSRLGDIRDHLEPASFSVSELSRAVRQEEYDRDAYQVSKSPELLTDWHAQAAIVARQMIILSQLAPDM